MRTAFLFLLLLIKKKNLFIWQCWVFVAGLRFLSHGEKGLFSSWGQQGLLSIGMHRLLIVLASVVNHGLEGMWA